MQSLPLVLLAKYGTYHTQFLSNAAPTTCTPYHICLPHTVLFHPYCLPNMVPATACQMQRLATTCGPFLQLVPTTHSHRQMQSLPHAVLAKYGTTYHMQSSPFVVLAKYGTTYHMQFLPNAAPTTGTEVLTIRSATTQSAWQMQRLPHAVLTTCSACQMQIEFATCGLYHR